MLGSVLAGQTTAQTVIAGVSPELNAKIHELTKESKTANILAHATLSAAEFYGAGLSPTAGAVAGVVGEGSAMLLSEKVFNKPVEALTTEERNILKTASQLVGAVMGGVVGDSTATVVEGMATSKRAVENNALSSSNVHRAVKDIKEALKSGKNVDEVYEKYQQLSEKQRAELLADCGIACRIPTERLLNNANELAEDYSGLLSGWVTGLSSSERSRFLEFIERENGKTIKAVDERKGTLEKGVELAIEASQILSKEGEVTRNSNYSQNYFAKKSKIQRQERVQSKVIFSTDSDATKAARQLGYIKTNYLTKSGAVVFKKGNSYITRDVDGHNGGAWKEASSPEKLNSKRTRNGTFDVNLKKIGD